MKLIVPALALIAGLLIAYLPLQSRLKRASRDQAVLELLHTRAAIEKQVQAQGRQIVRKLSGFAELLAGDRDFTMKLVAEQDRSAAEVSEVAYRFIRAMDLSLLEVTDSAYTLLSCGHFPAAAGNSVATKALSLDSSAVFIRDNIKGEPRLTLQARVDATIADAARISCLGGAVVDRDFLAGLTPREGVRLLFTQGDITIGMDSVETMSAIKDNTIIVNDTTWLATSIELPWSGDGSAPRIVVLAQMPKPVGLF
jgi:hypothetical protein